MKRYFVLFKRQKGQKTDAYSVVNEDTLNTIPKDIIKEVKEVPDTGIIEKADCKRWVEELGGVWYGN
jgi:hypothetical protein